MRDSPSASGAFIVIHGRCTAGVGLYLGVSHWVSDRWLTLVFFTIGWTVAKAAQSTWTAILETGSIAVQTGYTDLAYLFLVCFLSPA